MSILFGFMMLVGLLSATLVLAVKAVKNGAVVRRVVAAQIVAFMMIFGLSFGSSALMVQAATPVENTTTTAEAASTTKSSAGDKGMGFLAMGIAIGLASIGCGIAVAAAAPAAIGATSEDPKAFGKAIVFVGLAEGVAAFSLLVSLFIYGKLG